MGGASAHTFQRARRPEQVRARRESILAAARALLEGRHVSDVSLRELGDEVGLAASNVLHYFDSREAIFLELLDAAWASWLEQLTTALPEAVRGLRLAGPTRARRVAATLADSLCERPVLCELFSAQAAVLERNISLEFARDFKRRMFAHHQRFAGLLRESIPGLTAPASLYCAHMIVVLTGGLWPYAEPAPAVATALAELGQGEPGQRFARSLHLALEYQLVGAGGGR